VKKVTATIVLREYVESLLVAIVVAVFLRVFVVSAYKIPTSSMMPSLMAGDFVFAYKLPYGVPVPFTAEKIGVEFPKHGDVVVFRLPGNESVNYVKRVVGLPGERIEIKNKKLFINDVESQYQPIASEQFAKLKIHNFPGQEYYVVAQESFQKSTHFVMNRQDDEADFYGPIVVQPGHIFVLGDNRDSSDDSRYWGQVPVKNLEGRVLVIWMSLDWLERWANDRLPSVRWDRIFKLVD
jgi:signal peptidase I